MKFKTCFVYPIHEGIGNFEPSLTQQQFAEDADINVILERFKATGIPPNNGAPPQFVDFTQVPNNYLDAMLMVRAAEEQFMLLPGDIRAKLNHDPGKLEEYMLNPENHDELVKRGFKIKKDEPQDLDISPNNPN